MSSFFLLVYHSFTFLTLFPYGLYHLSLSLKSPPLPLRPYHPLPLPNHPRLRHLPLHLALASLALAALLLLLGNPSSLALASLHTSLSLLLFLLLALSLLLSPLPNDLTFLLASLSFALLALSPSPSSSLADLQVLSHSVASLIYSASALFSLLLALFPTLHLANFALALSVSLQGLWAMQSYFFLYVDAFVPDGCHPLLDVAEPATRCDLDSSRARAEQILDLAFAVHVTLVMVVGLVVYKVSGGGGGAGDAGGLGSGSGSGLGARRYNGGSYEALPTSSSTGELDHVQMKALGKSTAQA